ncbi:MAG: RagB/SusD family nutrient uptake outer membrane protein, partial [Lewinella sp.]
MKFSHIILFFAALLFVSCSEDYLLLENPNQLDSENFFKSEQDILTATNGVYADLQTFPGNLQLYMSEGRSSNYFSGGSNAQRDLVDISLFNVRSEQRTIETVWNNAYRLLSKANKVLSVIDDIEFSTPELKLQSEAEVRALRAYTYFELVRVFGKVPLIDRLISPEEALEIGRSEVVDIYRFIEEDLLFASENLPTVYPTDLKGKITRQATIGLRAKLYVTWAQFPIRDRAKIDLAIPLLESLTSGALPMNWSPVFEDIFKQENDNQFCLFEVQYVSGPAGLGALFPSEFLTSSMREFPFSGGIPRISPSFNLLADFDIENDLRFEATFDTSFVDNFFQTVNIEVITKWFEPGLSLLSRGDWPHNYPVLRPANIYLLLAEALMVKNDAVTTEAVAALNRTRERANISLLNTSTSKEEFLTELQAEYRREFVGEGHFW